MAVIEELICTQADSTISFGNYKLSAKSKVENFEHNGDLYKVKTYKEITKLEKNGMFVYESVPGTTVLSMKVSDRGMFFEVEGQDDVQITLGLEDEAEYEVCVDKVSIGNIKTNLSGKLSLSVELDEGTAVSVKVEKLNERQ